MYHQMVIARYRITKAQRGPPPFCIRMLRRDTFPTVQNAFLASLSNRYACYCRVIEQHNVNSLFCVPTALRVIRRADRSAAGREIFD